MGRQWRDEGQMNAGFSPCSERQCYESVSGNGLFPRRRLPHETHHNARCRGPSFGSTSDPERRARRRGLERAGGHRVDQGAGRQAQEREAPRKARRKASSKTLRKERSSPGEVISRPERSEFFRKAATKSVAAASCGDRPLSPAFQSATTPFHKIAQAPIFSVPTLASAMAINEHRNKPFGPGGGTRRLHQSPSARRVLAGAK